MTAPLHRLFNLFTLYEAKIFDAFFTTKEHLNSVGLGLSVSALLVRNFGGDLMMKTNAIDSDATRFVLRLNLAES